MNDQISEAGGADQEVRALVHQVWLEQLRKDHADLTGFDPQASLSARLAWAIAHQYEIGGVLARFSSKLQHSTTAQVSECVQFAAKHKIYVPPEYVCVDEAVSGRKARRDGLDRIKQLLQQKLVRVLLVFKVSRLFRVAYRGLKFFQEEIVEEGLRALSITQGIDTADEKTWKQLAYLHGMMDEMLIGTIADHVRAGLSELFKQGYVTGALPVGYQGVEVPGATPTKRGLPRKAPAVNPQWTSLIVQHFEWCRDGLPIAEGWRRWVAAGGPCDPRSSGRMSYSAYRRMLLNPRYTGCWGFGRKRNRWSSKRDYNRQIEQPETEVLIAVCAELRIISDELFYAVQARLKGLRKGPRGPKRRREVRLWDLVTDCFLCAACSSEQKPIRFYQAGAGGHGMRCKHGKLCPAQSIVRRDQAVRAVCDQLRRLLLRDRELLAAIVARALERDAEGDESAAEQLATVERALQQLSRKLDDLTELAGEGTDEDRAQLKARIRTVQAERSAKQAERAQWQRALTSSTATLTPELIHEQLTQLPLLLESAAAGKLGQDAVHQAEVVFRRLVGGPIWVHVEQRPGRKQKVVAATFTPTLLQAVQEQLGIHQPGTATAIPEVRIWLRPPPKKDRLAPRVHELIDLQGLSFRAAEKVLRADGEKVNSGVVWQIYHRYYEMIGQPAAERPYNNGQPRRPRDDDAA